ncbi:hypothetical protein NBRC116188_29470 [Oceaniserpentilla sp. 4NH20-0058]|uniref:ATP-binding protein n=1 Tax=Oceaniserpentilla sp. 4NH20-0058 TaxID=3127660 RepID=UPI00310492F3
MRIEITPKIVITALMLVVLGLVGNYLAMPIAYGVAFIFGSIFSILAIVLLRASWGVLVAVIVASYTIYLWNHPYAVIIFAMEAVWIGIALRRGQTNLVLIDALFWLSLGSILVVVFYGVVMGLSTQSVLMIVLKQSINGLFNALIASLLLYIPAIRKQGSHIPSVYTYKHIIFNTIAVFFMLPTLSLLLFDNYRVNIALHKQVATNVQAEIFQLKGEISQWVDQYLRAVSTMAQLPESHGLQPSQQLQQELARIKYLFPNFHNAYIADETGTTKAFYPAVNEQGESTIGLNFSDRAYFKALAASGQPIVSDVFIGRGGISEPVITISVPVMKNQRLSHFALGAVNLQQVQRAIRAHATKYLLLITLIDSKGNVVISSDERLKPTQKLAPFSGRQLKTDIDNVFLQTPDSSRNISIMQAWKESSYFSKTPIANTEWTLHVEYPLAPMQKELYMSAISSFAAVAALFIPMIFIAALLSKILTRPLHRLADISADLPNQIGSEKNIVWPSSNIGEIVQLVTNFQNASHALGARIGLLNNRLSLATSAAGIGVWDYYLQENKLIWDDRMYALYGISEGQFSGAYEAWKNGLHPDDMARSEEAIQLALNNEKNFDIEFRVLWPSGEIRYLKADAQVQWDENGQAIRMTGINYDVTERNQTIKKLEQAVNKAEVANEAKSEFLANMSHEIRTPMNGVIGMTNQLLRTQLDPVQHKFAKTVKSSAESLLSIINDILDFSKVEAGKLQLEPLNFDMNVLMQELDAVMRFRAEEKGLLLTCPINADEPLWAFADSGRIRQILINLVGNAIKFTASGEIGIAYELLSQENDHLVFKFEISDSGIGLSEEQQRTLFDRFSQADGSTTRRYGGTGLGLAISKQLVELMGGEIGVTSIQGKGSTFWFTLTLDNGQTPEQASDEQHSQLLATPTDSISHDPQTLATFSGKVLVVEDNAINRMVAQCQLEDLGLEVELAQNGQVAIEVLEQTTYDIVFMDCQMPIMDGFEASRMIRDPQSKVLDHDTPIIAMTANVIKGDREKCIAAGMSDYVSKPVDPDKLAQTLMKWLPKE